MTQHDNNEMMILGCMLNSGDDLKMGCESLDFSNFLTSEHQEIFKVLKDMKKGNKPPDIHLVCEELKRREKLQKVGGAGYITTLSQYSGTSTHVEHYIDQLIDDTTRRNLLELVAESSGKSTEEIKDAFIKKMDKAIEKKKSVDSLYRHLLEPASEESIIEEIRNTSPGVRVGLKIGDIDLELPGGAITIPAAPTSHGKTTVLINFAHGVLNQNPDKSVYFFSYEESMSSIMSLFLNTYMEKEISRNNRRSIESFFREGNCTHVKGEKQEQFLRDKDAFFTHLVDTGRLNVFYSDMSAEQLVQAIKYIKKNRDDVGAIFIDYMQLLYPLDKGNLSRQEQLKYVCLILKDCAVETGLPIVLGAQFNRQVTCEADLSPIYISEAGDIERIASLILGFWNRNFLGFTAEGNKTKSGKILKEKRPEIYMEVLKGRKIGNGHSSVLSFHGNMGKIDNSIADILSSDSCSESSETEIGSIRR